MKKRIEKELERLEELNKELDNNSYYQLGISGGVWFTLKWMLDETYKSPSDFLRDIIKATNRELI